MAEREENEVREAGEVSERRAGEMEARLDELDEDIDHARDVADRRSEDTMPDEWAGDWEHKARTHEDRSASDFDDPERVEQQEEE